MFFTGKNKKIIFSIVLALSMFFAFFLSNIPSVTAATSEIIPYQGKLTNVDGTNLADGAYNFQLFLYNALTSGTCVYTISGTCGTPTNYSVTVTNGIFYISIGDAGTNTLAGINMNQDLWLEVRVVGETLTPRKYLGGAAFTQYSSLTDPNANLSLAMGSNTSTYTYGTLTTQTGFTIAGNTGMTTGTLLALNTSSFNPGVGNTGNLANFSFTDNATNASGNSIVNGLVLNSTINTSGAGTKAINAINIATPIATACASGACTWTGLNIADPGSLANTTFYAATFQGGNVGVGTATPGANLHVNSASGTAELRLSGAAGSQSLLRFYEGTTDKWEFYRGTLNDFGIYDAVNGITRTQFTSTGDVFFNYITGYGSYALKVLSTGNILLAPLGGNVSIGSATATSLFNVGSSAQLQVDTSGNLSTSGKATITNSPAASNSALSLTGTILTGGTGATNFPLFFIQPAAATAVTTFSTAGTAIGVNSATGFTGNFLDFHVNGGVSVSKLDSGGNLTVTSCTGCGGGGASRLDQITAANTTATIDSLTNGIIWNWSTLTSQAALTLGTNTSTATTGTILRVGEGTTTYTVPANNTGNLVQLGAINTSNNSTANSTLNVLSVDSTLNTTAAGTKVTNGINFNAPTLTGCTGGNCTVNGFNATTAITGFLATIIQNGLNVSATGISAGTLNGVNISNITAGAGTESAINIGTGWDNSILGAGALSVATSANGNISFAPNGTGNISFTTGTTSGDAFAIIANSAATNNAVSITANGIDSGTGLYVSSNAAMTGGGDVAWFQNNLTNVGTILYLKGDNITTGGVLTLAGNASGSSAGFTTGSLISSDPGNLARFRHAAVETGSLLNFAFTDISVNTSGTSTTNGLNIASTINTTGAGLKNITILNVPTPTKTVCTSGACTWVGLNIATPGTLANTTFTPISVSGGLFKVDAGGNITVASCTGCGSSAALSGITAATATNTIDNQSAGTAFGQIWNWSTLTSQTGFSLGTNTTAATTGGILAVGGTTYVHTAAETGNLAKYTFTDASTNTTGNTITNGLNLISTVNTSGAGTKTISPINVAAPTLTACASGACTWNGLSVNTATSGAASTITQNGLNITATGISAGSLNGLNIGTITGGVGTESALKIGTGWDNIISSTNFSVTGTGNLTTAGTINTLTLATASSTPALTNGTIWYNSTTNRFNVVENGTSKQLCNGTDLACGTGSGAAISALTVATASNTINNINFAQDWGWGSLTTQIALHLGGGTAMTTGNILAIGGAGTVYVHTTAETGSLETNTFSDSSTNTSGATVTNGVNYVSILNTSGAGTKTINPINVSAPTITGCATGACTWNGLIINTATSGFASTLTQNGLNITPTGAGAGTLNGINIGGITAGAGAETALNIGGGWDTQFLLSALTADPSASATDTLSVYARKVAGRAMLTARDASNTLYQYQPSLYQRQIAIVAMTSGTNAMVSLGASVTALGGTLSSITTETSGYIKNFTAATATQMGIAMTDASNFRGSTPGANGFFFFARTQFPDASYANAGVTTGSRIFVGMTDQATTTINSADNPTGNRAGFSWVDVNAGRTDATTGFWRFSLKDNTTENLISTGMALTQNKVYDMYIYVAPQGSTVFWRIDNITDNTTQEGSSSTNLPTNSTGLRGAFAETSINAVTRNIRIQKMYIESGNW